MTSTLSTIGQLTRRGDPQRIPVIVHHSLTGKSGAVKAFGYDRGSYGRGSKVLLGWTRSQINLAPYGEMTMRRSLLPPANVTMRRSLNRLGPSWI